MNRSSLQYKPSGAFVGAAWAVLFIGVLSYLIGLWNSTIALNEKGYYFTVLLFGLFGAVSLQKSVRDRMDGIAVTSIYFSLCWVSMGSAILLLTIGLWNSTFEASEKGFYAMAYVLSMFAAITVQKNVRDLSTFEGHNFSESPLKDDKPSPSLEKQ